MYDKAMLLKRNHTKSNVIKLSIHGPRLKLIILGSNDVGHRDRRGSVFIIDSHRLSLERWRIIAPVVCHGHTVATRFSVAVKPKAGEGQRNDEEDAVRGIC